MLFHTVEYAVFLIAILALYYNLPFRFRPFLLILASYGFYMFWNPAFIVLLLTLTVIDYYAAIWIEESPGARRKLALILSLAANLGFLGFFKYANFAISNLAWLANRNAASYHLDIILPLGISFHTFQSISYVVDVYRREQYAIRRFPDYALFIAFFPQLVAGPIVRAREFFKDLYNWTPPSPEEIKGGIVLIASGVLKKLVLADQFAIVSDAYFRDVSAVGGTPAAWSATVAFAMQIFFDFSGYTDIAIGSAALFGFRFPVNFRRPYLATSITEFWRRWHISLSRWLRDYLYIPLGGNRHGHWRTYINLMLTMLIGGLWHGASWNFVIWGGYHGTLLAAERMTGISERTRQHPGVAARLLYALPVFLLVCAGWVFFRATTFADAMSVLSRMFVFEAGPLLLEKRHAAFIVVTLCLALLQEYRESLSRLVQARPWRIAVLTAAVLAIIEIFGVTDQLIPFVYFQF